MKSPKPPREGGSSSRGAIRGGGGGGGGGGLSVSVSSVVGSGVRYAGAVSANDPTPSDVNATGVVIAAIESVIDVDAVT
jgi:hypothetical protein